MGRDIKVMDALTTLIDEFSRNKECRNAVLLAYYFEYKKDNVPGVLRDNLTESQFLFKKSFTRKEVDDAILYLWDKGILEPVGYTGKIKYPTIPLRITSKGIDEVQGIINHFSEKIIRKKGE